MQYGQVAQKSDLLCNKRAPVLPTFVHTFFIKNAPWSIVILHTISLHPNNQLSLSVLYKRVV